MQWISESPAHHLIPPEEGVLKREGSLDYPPINQGLLVFRSQG
jgi:hypothetical protein